MRALGFVGLLSGITSGTLLVDILVENGSTSNVNLVVFGQPLEPIPHWLFLVLVATLGVIALALVFLGFRGFARGRERRHVKTALQQVREAETRKAELEAMQRVLTELNFELGAELEKLQQRKFELVAEMNSIGTNAEHPEELTTPFRSAATRKRRAERVVEAARTQDLAAAAGNGSTARRHSGRDPIVVVPDLELVADEDDKP